MSVYLDVRWSGCHGLGRMTEEVFKRNGYEKLILLGSPSSPLDPIRLSLAVFNQIPSGDQYLTFGYNAPIFSNRPFILTIADLNYLECPLNASFLRRLYFRTIVKRAANRAERVLTISEFSRRRILNWIQIPPERVINIGCGVSEEFIPRGDVWAPGYKYILMAGNRKAHKNESRGLRAFAAIQLASDIHLVLTGCPNGVIQKEIADLGMGSKVHFLGWVSNDELAKVYRGALCLLFPSLYEGFGLPVVEAMSCGTPVVTSNVTSIPEIAGDAALLFNPLEEHEIVAALHNVVTDDDLRGRLKNLGIRQAAKYTWSEVARKVEEVVRSVG